MSRSIDFFIAGFSHCGAETLGKLLGSHPEIHIARQSNPPALVSATVTEVEAWVQGAFKPARNEFLRGLVWDDLSRTAGADACAWLGENFPDAALVFVVRDPLDRAEAAYRALHTSAPVGGPLCPFDIGAALREFPELTEEGRYRSIVERFRSSFADDRIHVIQRETPAMESAEAFSSCLQFLGLAGHTVPLALDGALTEDPGHHDTERLRDLRDPESHPESARALAGLKAEVLDQFLPRLGLRVPFGVDPIVWRPGDEVRLVRALAEDTHEFLEWCRVTLDDWPRFASALRSQGS